MLLSNTNGPNVAACSPVAALADPCTCHDVLYFPNETLELLDYIEVTAPAGETWNIISHTGIEQIDPMLNIPLPVPSMLTYNPMTGKYRIQIEHNNAIGYSATLSNGIVTLTISNTCNMHEPTELVLPASICSDAATITLPATQPNFTTVYTIGSLNGTVVTSLDPSLYSSGSTVDLFAVYTPILGTDCPKKMQYSIQINAVPTLTGGTVCVGSTITLTGSGMPAAATPYVSSAPAVATVSSAGVVTGLSAGSTTITYTDINGCQATATIMVQNCCVPPSAVFIAAPAECDGGTPENNGRIVMMSNTGADRVGYSAGAVYSGPAYAAASSVPALPGNIVSNIPNGTSQVYTIRVFSGSNTCFTDYTVNVQASSACLIDPMGYIYCQETGQIVAGGTISVSGPGAVLITKNGSSGEYQFFTDGTAGTYTITYTLPLGYALSTTHLPLASIDPTGQPNPYLVGSGSLNGTTLDNFTTGANPYTFNFVLAPGDPEIQTNNIPLTGCCTAPALVVNNANVCKGGSINLATLVSNNGGGILSYYSTLADANAAANALTNSTVTVTTATNFYIRSQTGTNCFVVKEVTVLTLAPSCGTIQITGPH